MPSDSLDQRSEIPRQNKNSRKHSPRNLLLLGINFPQLPSDVVVGGGAIFPRDVTAARIKSRVSRAKIIIPSSFIPRGRAVP